MGTAYHNTLLNRSDRKIGRGSTRSHCVENLIWKRLWVFCETDNRMNEFEDCCVGNCKTLCFGFPEGGALAVKRMNFVCYVSFLVVLCAFVGYCNYL
jgi:hypothetical protein